MALPAIRNLDASPVEHQGQTMICLRDPEGFVEDQIVLTPMAFFIATQLDGLNDVTDIQYTFATQFDGQILGSDQVRKVVDYLDERGFLLSEKYQVIRSRVEEEFAQNPVRPPYFAGKSYPDDPEQLRAFLNGLFAGEGGPGVTPSEIVPTHDVALPGLVVPHIDFARGGAAYGHGYRRLLEYQAPDTVIIFGVAHYAPPAPIILTRKHFATPFGVVETDQEVVRKLESACAWNPYEFEIVHRTEHSVEFHAVMLAHLYGTTVRIVPVLCSSFVQDEHARNARLKEGVDEFLTACNEVVHSKAGKITVLAGADLAHVGIRFGDDFDIDDQILMRIAGRDREDLAHVVALDPTAFYRSVMQDRNERRVCGVNCIYACLKATNGLAKQGELLHYGCAPDPVGGVVSFADIAFT